MKKIFRKMFGLKPEPQLYEVRFFLKSGSSLRVICEDIKIVVEDGIVKEYSVTGIIPGARPLFINITTIDAIMSTPL